MVLHYDTFLRDGRLRQKEVNNGAIAKLHTNGGMLRIRNECRVVCETGIQAMGFDVQDGVDGDRWGCRVCKAVHLDYTGGWRWCESEGGGGEEIFIIKWQSRRRRLWTTVCKVADLDYLGGWRWCKSEDGRGEEIFIEKWWSLRRRLWTWWVGWDRENKLFFAPVVSGGGSPKVVVERKHLSKNGRASSEDCRRRVGWVLKSGENKLFFALGGMVGLDVGEEKSGGAGKMVESEAKIVDLVKKRVVELGVKKFEERGVD
ncbi:Uncharacterized protein Adt_21100 [Abeliophyllum distichum]|uniref:Uncharacterized protein n=1 Tax=Abeliophyllum distichum TaxID=126358 RepID=A0ABD1SYD2_9LAMI